ncbi:MAG: response regulator transcription factor [Clostridiales bacterium]|nr:response regulator transcription factor [Clostridiales bacterium]
MRILIVEDDADLCGIIHDRLKREGYESDICRNGGDAVYYIDQNAYDLVLLDRMLPGLDGTEILKYMRKQGIQAHVIITTALNGVGDRIEGLDAGADDYLVKPYDMDELLARIRAVSRRPARIEAENLVFEDISLNLGNSTLIGPLGARELSSREAALMEILVKNPNLLHKRANLIAKVWGPDASVEDGNLDNYIHFLRRRLKAVNSSVIIKTARGQGYTLEMERDCLERGQHE